MSGEDRYWPEARTITSLVMNCEPAVTDHDALRSDAGQDEKAGMLKSGPGCIVFQVTASR